jgi:hypothetical protein
MAVTRETLGLGNVVRRRRKRKCTIIREAKVADMKTTRDFVVESDQIFIQNLHRSNSYNNNALSVS